MTQTLEKINNEFIGIDVAKDKLDICLGDDNKKSSVSNSAQGFKQLKKSLPEPARCIVVLEPIQQHPFSSGLNASCTKSYTTATSLNELGHF